MSDIPKVFGVMDIFKLSKMFAGYFK